jgi:hypothetical protein
VAHKSVGCSFFRGVSCVEWGIRSTIIEVIMHTWVDFDGGIHGGSPWYVPRREGS